MSNTILVEIPDDSGIEAILYFMDKEYSCVIGKNGAIPKLEKREGDNKTPLGRYQITQIFSYHSQLYWEEKWKKSIQLPFIHSDESTICVDDSDSKFYNKVVDSNKVEKDWISAEEMLRKDRQYELGLIINHNFNCQAGMGSCIFIHVFKSFQEGTAGCIALKLEDLEEIVQNLDDESFMEVQLKK